MSLNVIKKYGLSAFVLCAFAFLYIPIIVLFVFSFNASSMPYQWGGFSTQWYVELLHSSEAWQAVANSLIVAASSVALSVLLSLLLVFYASSMLRKFLFVFYGCLIVPEIVLAVGVLGLFSLFSVPLGFVSLIVAHTILGLGYALPIIHARFESLEEPLIEASYDLGATPMQTFTRVVLPLLFPAVFAAATLAFIISFDDFIIAFFCAGASSQTLPLYIFSVVRSGGSPLVNALSAILLCVGGLLVVISSSVKVRKGLFFGD